jgi:Lon-like protease
VEDLEDGWGFLLTEGILSRRQVLPQIIIPLGLTNISLDISWLLVTPVVLWATATIYVPIRSPDLNGWRAWLISILIFVGVMVSLAIHTLAHAWTTRISSGDVPARLPIHLLGDIAHVWPTVPNPRFEILAPIAGIIAQVFLAIAAYFFWNAQINHLINAISFFLLFFNLGLVALNLTPAFPFDGGRLTRAVGWNLLGKAGLFTRLAFLLGFCVSLLFAVWGVFCITRQTYLSLETGIITFILGGLVLYSLVAHTGMPVNRFDRIYRLRLPSHCARIGVFTLLVLLLAVVPLSLLPMNYGIEAPGFTASVEPMVQLPPQYRYPSKGSLLISSVILQAPILVGEWVYGHWDNSIKLVPQEKIIPITTTVQSVAQTDYQALLDSETTAVIVGMRLAGYTVNIDGNKVQMPFPVNIIHQKTDGGPSAGLMFTLGVYNAITPQDLTGGRKIAGTGTIDLDARVGPIGGVQQKVVAAERSGAQYFLCPSWNYQDALKYAKNMQVIKVDTVLQAIDFLSSLPPKIQG